MKTPAFWQTRNALSTLLLPLAWCYERTANARQKPRPDVKPLSAPVICIGNLTAGGAGKTPVAIAIGERIKERSASVWFLSRGYGGNLDGPIEVNPKLHTAKDVGDEPLLLARHLRTVISKDRQAGAQLAMERGARAIIMDDGFQNPSIAKNLSLLVIDSGYGFGNGRLIPAGPLRESPEKGFARADAIISIGGKTDVAIPDSLPVIEAELMPDQRLEAFKDKLLLPFCGIGRPEKFFAMLKAHGCRLADQQAFADHHPYSESDLKKLAARAKVKGALLVTTEKDAARLTPEWRSVVHVVAISLVFKNPEALDALLDKALLQTW